MIPASEMSSRLFVSGNVVLGKICLRVKTWFHGPDAAVGQYPCARPPGFFLGFLDFGVCILSAGCEAGKIDLPNYSVTEENPLGSYHRGGTFTLNSTI